MDIRLDYGRGRLKVSLADDLHVSVIERPRGEPLADPTRAIEEALTDPIGVRPLAELARHRRDAVVVISDKTRPVPNGIVLPPFSTRSRQRASLVSASRSWWQPVSTAPIHPTSWGR